VKIKLLLEKRRLRLSITLRKPTKLLLVCIVAIVIRTASAGDLATLGRRSHLARQGISATAELLCRVVPPCVAPDAAPRLPQKRLLTAEASRIEVSRPGLGLSIWIDRG